MKNLLTYLSFFCFINLFLNGTISQAQDVTESWVARYNGPGNSADYGRDIAVDASGNVYVTGRNISGGVTRNDIVTIKYNTDGDEVWQAVYDGPGNAADDPTAIAIDEDGNVYVTGYCIVTLDTVVTVTLKYNNDGVEQWATVYPGPKFYTVAEDITVDNNGNVYITGYEFPKNSNNKDCFTIKYNSFGEEEWVVSYNSASNHDDNGEAIAVDDSGNVYVTGESTLTGVGFRYMTTKYNSSGEEQWVNFYNNIGEGNHEPADIAVDAMGNVYITGRSHSSGAWGEGFDYATIKYSSEGNQEWVARYNGIGNNWDEATALALDASGNIYVTGKSKDLNGKHDYVTIKYNNSGVEQWIARYNGPANTDDQANAIVVDDFGNVYVTGSSMGIGTSFDYATVKYNSAGEEQWVMRYNKANGADEAVAIDLDSQGNVYITGYSCSGFPITTADFATIKYLDSIVPVELTSFSGIVMENNVILNWATSTELNNKGFEVQKINTFNSDEIWETVGFVPGSGTTAETNTYSFIDKFDNQLLKGTVSYRLKQIDFNGSYEYSKIIKVEVDFTPKEYKLHQNYPNPFNPSTTIKYALPFESHVRLSVYNTLGELIEVLEDAVKEAGYYDINWNASYYSSGIYIYTLEASATGLGTNNKLVKKMLLQK
ncbi:MAG: SBBP repeat-containing protein [Ignavibacteriaceae bacterium]|jgi:uncharacterized delta-60 repeat protein|nr:SBBP repeat-containing protein [Ignavibacteriaceae bacterium]